jgi:hypothetical protein
MYIYACDPHALCNASIKKFFVTEVALGSKDEASHIISLNWIMNPMHTYIFFDGSPMHIYYAGQGDIPIYRGTLWQSGYHKNPKGNSDPTLRDSM